MDFDHSRFRFIELANQRNVLTGIWSSPTWGPDPELIDMVGDLDLEDYEKAKIGEIQLPPIVGTKKKNKVLLGLPAVPSLAQLTVSLMYRESLGIPPRH
jgi:hypothetical protein